MADSNPDTEYTLQLLGYKGVIKASNFSKKYVFSRLGVLALLFSVITIIVVIILDVDVYILLNDWTNLLNSLFPNILGFTLSGYAIMISFVQTKISERITNVDRKKGRSFSIYQSTNGVMAMNLLIQVITLIFSCTIHFVVKIDELAELRLYYEWPIVVASINLLALFFLVLLFAFSMIIMLSSIVNLFNYGQIFQYMAEKNAINESKKSE